MVLEVKNLTKSFHGQQVLKGIDLSVDAGDATVILGPSGAGKTTLLRCMNFLETADGGEITFDGKTRPIQEMTKKEIRAYRMNTAFVFQGFNLFLNKNALANVTEGLTVVRKTDKATAKRIGMEALARVGLADHADKYPHQLSGGQQQRVAIARALATDPEIIFFDEPTSALDPELTGEVLSVMRSLAADGMTMLIVTHEIEFARTVSNRIVFMEDGRVVEAGESKRIFTYPEKERTAAFLKLQETLSKEEEQP